MKKMTSITFRINEELKNKLKLIAEKEHRSLTNTIEVLIMNYFKMKEGE